MALLSKKKNYPLGLDISESSLKMVQLGKNRKGKITLNSFNITELPQEAIVNGDIRDEEEVIKNLKELFGKAKINKPSTKQVVASLPESKTFIKLIKVEDPVNKVEDIIESEMEKNIPFSSQNVYYDWQTIEDKKDHQLLLLGVAPKGVVEQYYDLLSKAGLAVEALEIEPVAICRAILDEETPVFEESKGKNYIVIDIGFSHSTIIFYSRNTILFTTETQLSGEKITREIAEHLNIDRNKAEKYKTSLSKKNDNYKKILEIIDGNLEELNTKLSRALDFYYDNYSDRGGIESVFLVGGGGYTERIKDAITCFPASVEIKEADPLVKISKGKKAKKFFQKENVSLRFTTSIGMALSKIFIQDK